MVNIRQRKLINIFLEERVVRIVETHPASEMKVPGSKRKKCCQGTAVAKAAGGNSVMALSMTLHGGSGAHEAEKPYAYAEASIFVAWAWQKVKSIAKTAGRSISSKRVNYQSS